MTITPMEPMGSELTIRGEQANFSQPQRVALAHMGVDDKAPDADVQVFFHVCQRTKLDPFAKQIYMIGRDQNELVAGEWRKVKKYTIQTGIDGYRTIARRIADESGDELAYGDTVWCGPDGVWRDVWLGAPEDLVAAKATVYRAGKRFTHVALFREYMQTMRTKAGEIVPNTRWQTAGANQLAKCAEAGALRKAYPQDLGGLYVDAETEHLANEVAAASVVQGGRDWFADAAAATTIAQLKGLWSEAHRAHVLDAQLQQAIKARQAELEQPAASEPPVERVDETTGEVMILDAEIVSEPEGVPDAAAVSEPAPAPAEGRPVRRATVVAITRELERCGVDPAHADAYLPTLGVPRDHLTDLTHEEAVELLDMVRTLDRDKLAGLAADAAGRPTDD